MNTCKECLADYPEEETVWRFTGYVCEWCLSDLNPPEKTINDVVKEIAEDEAH